MRVQLATVIVLDGEDKVHTLRVFVTISIDGVVVLGLETEVVDVVTRETVQDIILMEVSLLPTWIQLLLLDDFVVIVVA